MRLFPRCLIFSAGLVLALALPPFDFLPLSYAAFALFFWVLNRAIDDRSDVSKKRFFIYGWLFGFGQFLTGLYWLGNAILVEAEMFLWVLPFAVIGVPAVLAIYIGVAVYLWRWMVEKFTIQNHLARALLLALCYGYAEILRGVLFTGFPWNQPLMFWATHLPLAQSLSMWGHEGFILIVLVSLFAFATLFTAPRKFISLGVAAAPLFVSYLYAMINIEPATEQTNIKIAIVQPNIEQAEKWRPENRQMIIDRMVTLTSEAVDKGARVIVWPEVALPFYIDEQPDFARLVAQLLPNDYYLYTGAIRRADGRHYNSVILWSGRGEKLSVSDKHRLVPFGEFLPFQNILEAWGFAQLTQLRGGFAPAPALQPLINSEIPQALPLICYEAIFPLSPQNYHTSQWLLNVTNDAWFGTSAGPYQHLAHARLRAIETGLPLIRAANTGVSAVFDQYGRLVEMLPLNKTGVLTVRFPDLRVRGKKIYFNDITFLILTVILLTAIFILRRVNE